MKKVILILCLVLLLIPISGCTLIENIFGSDDKPKTETIDKELSSATGKWTLSNDNDTYFVFDGKLDKMTFIYVEDGETKFSGSFFAIYHGESEKVLTPLTLSLKREGNKEEDWLSCYVDDFKTNFSQFTVMEIEKDLGFIDGTIYSHIYRISELPYKMGTYILDGKEEKQDKNIYSCADKFNIESGTFNLSPTTSFTVLSIKPRNYQLFQYVNNGEMVEGSFWIAEDKKSIYLYIENDPFSKVKNADKDNYDTTFDIYYPPDFYLYGDFSKSDSIEISGLYHHEYSPTDIKDSLFSFGTYVK